MINDKPINDLYHYAVYTEQLCDVLRDHPDFLDNLVFPNETRTTKFKEIFIAMWYNYEVTGETIEESKTYIDNLFKKKVDYYNELLDAYETQINMLDGRLETISTTSNRDISDTTSNENIDLPNKVTSQEYITDKQKGNREHQDNYTNTINIKGRENVIELKRQYMKLLRNVYEEFAKEFEVCFITLYS